MGHLNTQNDTAKPGRAVSQKRGNSLDRRKSSVIGWVALAAAVAVVTIGGTIGARPALYATGLWVDGGEPTISPSFFDRPSATGSAQPHGLGVQPSAVAAPTGTAPVPAVLAGKLDAVPVAGMGTTSGMVLDAATGAVLWQRSATTGLVPASTMKLLTSTAALQALGPDTTFTTRVVSPSAGRIVLVGGGDPYLGSVPAKAYPWAPSSSTLAASTAAALKKSGVTTVTLGVDESLFTGPAWHPTWPASYHDQVSTISALWIDKGRPAPTAAPSTAPAVTAGAVFAAQLKANGITVTGTPAAAKAQAGDAPVASIASLPVRTLVSETLLHSDNSAAEVLLRHVGLATKNGGSFVGGTTGVQQVLTELGTWGSTGRLADGSGLSRSNLVTADTLARTLQKAATTPRLAPLAEGLPAAGVTGTLGARFYGPTATSGRGWVRAKTGTLTGVSTLAGRTRTASGGEVVFAFMSNQSKQEWGVRNWLDQMASVVTSCGC